jgi:hypothetical protein
VFADDSTLLVDGINGSIPYSVLSGAPTIPAAQVQSNWTAANGMGVILNKPTLSAVATTGAYADLTGKPTLFSGSYADLTNKPNIAGTYQFSVAADDSTQRVISNNELIKFIGAGTVTTASDAEGNITITGSGGSSLVNGAHQVALVVSGAGPYVTFPADDGVSISFQGGDINIIGGEALLSSTEHGVRLSANSTGTRKDWEFATDGSLTLPGDLKWPSGGGNIRSDGNINIEINLGDSTLRRWQFGEDGELTIPGSIIGNNTIEINNRDSGNTADINLYSADDILIQARDREGDSGSEGGDINIYAGDSAVGSDATGGDVQIRGGDGGAGDGYDNGGDGGFVTINGGNGGAASGIYSARNGGYLTLRAGNAGNNGGNIDLGAEGGNVTINAGNSTGNGLNGGTIYLTSGAADASALAGDVVIQAGGTWTFGGDGALTIPGDIKSQGNVNIDINLTDSTLRRWQFGEDGILTLPSTGKISNSGYDWTFGSNGSLTFPDNTISTGKGITIPEDQSLTVNLSYASGPVLATAFKINPRSIKLPEASGIIFAGTETNAGEWGLDSGNRTLRFPDAGDYVYPQIRYSNAGDPGTGMELITGNKSIKITADTKSWTFGTDGRLLLPNNTILKDTVGNAIAFGYEAGQNSQGGEAVAIGTNAGYDSQGADAVAIGTSAGETDQGEKAVAIGDSAGYINQGDYAVAIGHGAGNGTQGSYAVAIGMSAGETTQAANSIIINATGATLNQTTANTFTVAPIRNISATSGVLQYNASTKEVSYSNSVTAERFNTDQIIVVGNRISTTVSNANLELECNGTGSVIVNGGKLILNTGGNAYVESVDYGVNSANSALNIFGGPYQKINLRAGFGTQATLTLATDGTLTLPGSIVGTATQAVFNTTSTTVNAFGAATTALNIGASGAPITGFAATATTSSTASSLGYLGLPQSATATTATLAIGDASKHIYVTTNSQTITIPANASVAYPIGTTLTFIAGPSATTVTIAITSDTLRLAGGTSTGSRTLAANGMATAVKVAATTWYINGTGLT